MSEGASAGARAGAGSCAGGSAGVGACEDVAGGKETSKVVVVVSEVEGRNLGYLLG